MSAAQVFVNDIDLSDYGFGLNENTRGHADSPALSDVSVPVVGFPGVLWAGEETVVTPRALPVGGFLSAATNALLIAAEDNLKALCADGAVRIRFGDRTDQEFRNARMRAFSVTPRGALNGVARNIVIEFLLDDPLRYRINPDGYALTTARVRCPLGTAPSAPVIILSTGGSATAVVNPVITIRNAVGAIVQTMTCTGSIAQNDFWRVDSARASITKSIAGTASDGISLWTAGDFVLLRPADAWFEQAAWPTVELSSSAGAAVGAIMYWRRYL